MNFSKWYGHLPDKLTCGIRWSNASPARVPIANPIKTMIIFLYICPAIEGMTATPASDSKLITNTDKKPYSHTIWSRGVMIQTNARNGNTVVRKGQISILVLILKITKEQAET